MEVSGKTEKKEAIREIIDDLIARQSHEASVDLECFAAAHPELMPELAQELREFQLMRAAWQHAGEDSVSLGGTESYSFGGGRYQVKSLLGEGGQKRVFLAHDNQLDRDVVIGVLNGHNIESDSLSRLKREAKAMACLDEHANVVSVFDIGEEDGDPYLVTQYVRGGSVAELLSARRPEPLGLSQALRIAAQTCRALGHAHAHEILHRDVKPANVWLMTDGTVKLGDFGLALSLDRSNLTEEDMRVGTAAYMAPEQALGAAVGPQADLYSLGVMLYEMIAGRRPFYGDTALAVISQHVNSRPVAPSWHNPAIGDALDKLVLTLLKKSPDHRPASAELVADALEAMLAVSHTAVTEIVPARQGTSLDRLASGVFVGRIDELGQLRDGLQEAIAGRGRLYLISGEPGSGKTRLTEELSTYARMRGAGVLVGKCFEGEGAPAFWPWVQALRRFTQDRRPEELHDVMGPGAADIAQLDSEIRQRLGIPSGSLPTPPMLEPEQARFRLFDSITTLLRNAACSRPLLLVLDDLHWADEPSLRLLQFLAQNLRESHLLIVGTYRDVALDRGHPLARTLADIGREDLGSPIRLEGLSREDVGRCIELTSGIHPPEVLVQRIWYKTEGNPFFVNETIRLLITEGLLERPEEFAELQIHIPPRVRDVVRLRLEQLSDHCNKTLTLAAVFGREFPWEVIEALSDAHSEAVLDDLEEAVDARIIAEARGSDLKYVFTHDLVREAVCDRVTTVRRMRMHARIAEVLESLYQGREIEHHLAELAQHFVAAGRAADPDKAIEYSVRAGRRSLQQLAHEEAARHFGAAVNILKGEDAVDRSQLCGRLQDLGEAHRRAGQFASSLETFRRAFDVARNIGASDQMATAAIAFEWLTWGIGKPDATSVLLCNEALRSLSADRKASRAKLMAAHARALQGVGSADEAANRAREAVELARQAREPSTLCYVLELVLHMISGPVHIGQRLSYALEFVTSARATGDLEKINFAIGHWMYALFETGDVATVDRAMEEHAFLLPRIRQPQYTYMNTGFVIMRALLEGRFADAERIGLENLSLGQRLQLVSAEGMFGMLMFVSRREQGRLHEVAPIVETFVKEHSASSWKPGLALMYFELGLMDKAQALFEELAVDEFADIPQDGVWAASITFLVEVCASLGDRRRADVLYRLLSPYAGYAVIASEWACFGAGSRFLGQLAATMERWQEAEQHFEQALAMNDRMRAMPWLASTQYHYAQMLLARRAPGDDLRATTLLSDASAITRTLGMKSLEIRIADALRETAGTS